MQESSHVVCLRGDRCHVVSSVTERHKSPRTESLTHWLAKRNDASLPAFCGEMSPEALGAILLTGIRFDSLSKSISMLQGSELLRKTQGFLIQPKEFPRQNTQVASGGPLAQSKKMNVTPSTTRELRHRRRYPRQCERTTSVV